MALYNKNNILITVADGLMAYRLFTAKNAYITLRVANNSNESVYLEPRDTRVNDTAVSTYFSPNKVPAKTVQLVKLKYDDLHNASTFNLKLYYNFKVRTSSYKVNERASYDEPFWVSF